MGQEDFLMEEYRTLRDEIKETKSRIFQLGNLGIIGIPSSYFLAESYKQLEILRVSLPLLMCIVMLFFLSETKALMRCGKYIKDNIETSFQHKGWERWLEEDTSFINKRRIVDILVNVFFNFLFIFYYVMSVKLALETKILSHDILLGGLVLFFLITTFKASISTSQ